MPLIPTPISIPHTFQDNVKEANSGVQVNENLAALKGPLDTLVAAVEGAIYIGGHAVQIKVGEIGGTTEGSGKLAFTFPVAFPTALVGVVATANDFSTTTIFSLQARSRTGFTVFTNVASTAITATYIAIGY